MNMKSSMKGAKEMAARLRELAVKTPLAVEKALFEEAGIEMTEAKRRTPVDTGKLRASGLVHEPERKGRNISVELTFGNEEVDYAVPVHENLDAFHEVGQAKYLESTLKESAPHMKERLAKRLQLKDINEKS